jgi:uncharacterized protein (TIGR02145 family)
MRKENYMCLFFAGVAALFFTGHSVASAAIKVVVIPLSKTSPTTCTAPGEVQSAGQCWKDRNLGASRVAESSTDTLAYGDLYQWGRPRDGHQLRDSVVMDSSSSYDDPAHDKFLIVDVEPFDWRVPQNDNLWQGLGGINNPCSQGFRLPTATELELEMQSWGSNDAAGAFGSPLNLVVAGDRARINGALENADEQGWYWSSTVDSISLNNNAINLFIYTSNNAGISSNVRIYGFSVRCIKD